MAYKGMALNFSSYAKWCATWGELSTDELLNSWVEVSRNVARLNKLSDALDQDSRDGFPVPSMKLFAADQALRIESVLLKAHHVEAVKRGLQPIDLKHRKED